MRMCIGASWALLAIVSWGTTVRAEMVTRRWGRPPKGPPGAAKVDPAVILPVKKPQMEILPCLGGEGVVRFDLSGLPKGTDIYRADLLIFRTSAVTGRDEDARTDIEIYPQFTTFVSGGEAPAYDMPLALRGPWHDRFDATEAVRQWARGEVNGGFFVKACPRWHAAATCLDVAYEGRPEVLPHGETGGSALGSKRARKAASAAPVRQPLRGVPPQVADLEVFHAEGQTFITFNEIEEPVGRDDVTWSELRSILDSLDRRRQVRYCVYRSEKPITAGTLPEAECIARVRALSCWNVNGRNIEEPIDRAIGTQYALMWHHGNPFGQAAPDGPYGLQCRMGRLIIREGEPPLCRGTGLYVHTAAKPARAYYAVVTSVDGVENTAAFSPANALTKPVEETPAEPAPVLQRVLPGSRFWNYPGQRLHYVRWVGPPYGNLPYQYYNWSVALPARLRAAAPLELNLHPDNGSYYRTQYRIERDSVVISPHDFPLRTWWYGYHECQGTLRSFGQGVIHNYTERRVLSFIEWACGKWPIDRSRILVTGVRWSGGSGALHLGLRHPEVFNLVLVGHGIPDYARAIRDTRTTRRRGMLDQPERIWGKVEWGLKTDTGKSVWDELTVTKLVRERPANADLPLVAMTAQHYIAWGLWPQWHEFFNVMLEKRHAIVASFQWYGGKVLPVSATGTYPNVIRLDVRKDRSMLAFKGPGTTVLEKPTGGMGLFNLDLRWRGDDLVDRPDRYEVTVFWAGRQSPVTAQVTLRRLQKFRVEPGKTYQWINRSLEDGKALQKGETAVGEDGLLTIEAFDVLRDGSRLIVTRK